jgi:hypothetical protein
MKATVIAKKSVIYNQYISISEVKAALKTEK